MHKMVAVNSSKMFIAIYQSTGQHIQEKKSSVEVGAPLEYYAACSGNSLPMFWDNLSVLSLIS